MCIGVIWGVSDMITFKSYIAQTTDIKTFICEQSYAFVVLFHLVTLKIQRIVQCVLIP